MNLQGLRDERAVSPVIGVILMVAVTVILAAVIGTFVLGIGSQVTGETPRVSFGFVFENGGDGFTGTTNDYMKITHRSGDEIKKSNTKINVAGTTVTSSCISNAWPSEISAGDQTKVDETAGGCSDLLKSGNEVKIIWEEEEGGSTAIIGNDKVP